MSFGLASSQTPAIVNAIASLVAPRFFTSGGTTYDLNGASISYTLSDASNGAGGAGASNMYVRVDWSPTSSSGGSLSCSGRTTCAMSVCSRRCGD